MRRVALALVVSCGSPPATTTTVPIPLAAADASAPPHVTEEHVPAISLLMYHQTCLLQRGKLRCRHKLTPDVPFSKEPTFAGLEDVKQASLGRDFGCAVLRGGDVDCWGGNHFGQLGANVRDPNHEAPVRVVNLHGVKSVFAGPGHSCAVLDDRGRVACWGKNQFGENGSTTQYLEAARELVEPQVVPGVDGVVEMALGWDATYAATSNGSVITWGKRKLKEEPHTPEWTEEPRALASLEGTTALTSDEATFCGIQRDKLICWGQVYSFTKSISRDEIITIPIEHPRRVRIASSHGCAVDARGAVWCFGANTEGQLGVPPPSDRYAPQPPVQVPGVTRAVDVACTYATTCAVTASDEVYCWGRFTYDNEVVYPPTKIPI